MTSAGVTVYVKKTLVTNVAANDIKPTQATISWTGTEATSNYKVRYRVKQNSELYSTDFEGGLSADWTTFNNDDDEHNWTHDNGTKKGMAHSGSSCMYSASYINNYGTLDPDNWLVSPRLTLGGTMKVWLKGQDGDEFREHFAIYLSTAGGSKDDFLNASGNLQEGVITLVPETETTGEYQEYTADLSAYNGRNQTGYIAIRHFNCFDQFYLVLDDFSLYDENAGGEWATVSGGSPATIAELTPGATYEYQVEYQFGGNTYYSSTATLTTLDEDVAPTNLSVTAINANTATISWTGYGTSYNLRYSEGGMAKVTLSVPNDFWYDGSGYQMLLDADHDTYGSVIPETGGLTNSGDASSGTYAEFEYKIPVNADGGLGTKNIVDGSENNKSVTITIPAGIYDWCITNPSPNDRVWIASERGNIGGRQNDFVFEAGKHYTFTVTFDEGNNNDCVNMFVEVESSLEQGDETNLTDITSTSYALSGLAPSTGYTIYLQSVKGTKTSEWIGVSFTTTDETSIGLVDNQDNSSIITDNAGQQRKVTLVGRTLYKDDSWNTLCLPFDVTIAGSALEGATVMELDVNDKWKMDNGKWIIDNSGTNQTGLDSEGTLYLFFKEATSIEAGKPYIIKWDDGDNIVDPTFSGVTINNTASTTVTAQNSGLSTVKFIGSYAPVPLDGGDASNLYLGAGNKLYYPSTDKTINAFRGYFHVDLGTNATVRAFVLNFGDEETTGIISTTNYTNFTNLAGAGWYDLSGRKLSGKPTKKGVYIQNGRKVVIK
jgi:hypothetical protein